LKKYALVSFQSNHPSSLPHKLDSRASGDPTWTRHCFWVFLTRTSENGVVHSSSPLPTSPTKNWITSAAQAVSMKLGVWHEYRYNVALSILHCYNQWSNCFRGLSRPTCAIRANPSFWGGVALGVSYMDVARRLI